MAAALLSGLLTEILIPVAALIGIAFSLLQYVLVSKVKVSPDRDASGSNNSKNGYGDYLIEEEEGMNDHNVVAKCAEIQTAISEGATSFLYTEYRYVGMFMVAFAILVFVFLGSVESFSTKEQPCTYSKDKLCKPALANAVFSTIAFLLGAITSLVSGFLGMKIATYANARTTLEARKGVGKAFIVAFRSGAVMGFLLAANGLLVLYIAINLFKIYYGDDWEGLFEAITGYGLGGSSMALFGRVGGGIYTKAADVGADLVGKIERNIPEDDPRNPAVIADNVGDNVGDIAGMGSDLFGSYAESSCAALVVASISSFGITHDFTAMCFPLLVSSMGIIVCLITTLFATDFFEIRAVKQIEPALKKQLIISTFLMTFGIAIVSFVALPSSFTIFNFGAQKEVKNWELFFCVAVGLWAGLVIGFVTEYYTSNAYSPVQDVADSCRTGAATNVIFGLALGYKSVIIPIFAIAVSIFVSFSLAAMYGIAVAALGMLSTIATGLAIDAYGPISDNAGGIAEMAGMSHRIRERTDALDAAGNTTAAIGKGFAIGSAALVSLALFGAFVSRAGISTVDVLTPKVFIGLIVGAMLPHVSIWDYYGHKKHALMDEMEKTLDDANIQMDQDILVEVHTIGNGACVGSVQENGSLEKDLTSLMVEPCKSSLSVAEGLSTSKNVSRSCSSEQAQSQYMASPSSEMDNLHGTNGITTRGATLGLTGLQNLGNTCFMNSAIQCLVHTPEFARYFREDYHQEINWQNPLGMVGELALAFGELLRKLWAPGRGAVSPRPFKTKLARFAPQFSGYSQHDSQELLAFLLDGLHEDLNRVKHKPYVNSKDADGRPDEVVADEYWANHIARNDSIIVDVCQGQYKSTLICPVCAKVSVTFDPFMYLSLPLQSASARTMTVLVFSCDGSALPTPCTVSVPKQGRLKDLVQALSTSISLKNEERLLIAEIRGHVMKQVLEDPFILLSTIKDDDHLVAYKLLKVAESTVTIQIVHRREELEPGSTGRSMVLRPFGTPLLTSISCNEKITRDDLLGIVRKMLIPMLHPEVQKPSIFSKSRMGTASEVNRASSTSKAIVSAESGIQDREDTSTSEATAVKQNFQLFDENGEIISVSPGEDKAIRLPSKSMLMYINWSEKGLKKYDTQNLENLPEVCKYASAPKRARSESLSLYACLDAFLREEPLVPEDMWYCPRCKERRQASKKLDLWRLPEVLVIHLKRFSFSRSTKHKLETFVNFPIHDLDLTNYVARKGSPQRQLYELYALSNHYGSMGSGHYTAFIKLMSENKWYNFDDSHIYSMGEEDVRSAAAYVLFYRRVKGGGDTTNGGAQ